MCGSHPLKNRGFMRALASYLVGLFTLTALMSAGSAWQFQDGDLVPVDLSKEVLLASADDWLGHRTIEAAAPLIGECRPPDAGSVCFSWDLVAPAPPPPGPYDLIPEGSVSPEDWRPLVSVFFEASDVDRALRIISCESRGIPSAKNPTSSASGLFQHLASRWDRRAAKAGWTGADVFDPVANVAVASWLVYSGGGWSHWDASGQCW